MIVRKSMIHFYITNRFHKSNIVQNVNRIGWTGNKLNIIRFRNFICAPGMTTRSEFS